MAQSTVLTVVCLLLSLQCCVTGVQGAGGLGEACVSNACTNTALHVCDTNIDPPLCKVKQTGTCTSDDDCVAGATCTSDNCACTPTTTVANGDLCDTLVDQDCTTDAECVDHGSCDTGGSDKCKCDDNYFAKNDNTKCLAKIGQPCADKADCVPSAGECNSAQQCACGSTKVATDDFVDCKLQAGQTGCNDAANCTANAACQGEGGTKTCTCTSGFSKQTSGKCSGAAAMTASALLLTLAVLVTSRLEYFYVIQS